MNRWPLQPSDLPTGTVLVGGAVRDALLDRLGSHPDLDLVVPQGAIQLARQLAKHRRGTAVVLDAERDMARLVLGPWSFDLAAREGVDLISDLQRRDYSINAMALPLAADQPLQDPCAGLQDLQQRLLRAVCETNLLADPLRLLRGPRLAAELRFQLQPATAELIAQHHHRLAQVAPERVLAELEKLAACPAGEQGLHQAVELGLLTPWLEPLAAHDTPLDASPLSPAEASDALPLARLSRLLSANALRQLHSSKRLQQRCARLRHWAGVLEHAEPLNEATWLQLCRELEHDMAALVLLRPEATRGWLRRWRDPGDPLFHPRPPLDGRTLQEALGLPPGRALGQLLERLMLERAFGRAHDLTAAEALCRD
jgi:tRNA nucleotidyltransferase (CCA-adding enzyme)